MNQNKFIATPTLIIEEIDPDDPRVYTLPQVAPSRIETDPSALEEPSQDQSEEEDLTSFEAQKRYIQAKKAEFFYAVEQQHAEEMARIACCQQARQNGLDQRIAILQEETRVLQKQSAQRLKEEQESHWQLLVERREALEAQTRANEKQLAQEDAAHQARLAAIQRQADVNIRTIREGLEQERIRLQKRKKSPVEKLWKRLF